MQVLPLACFTNQSLDISSFGDSWLDKLGELQTESAPFVVFCDCRFARQFFKPTSISSTIVVSLDVFSMIVVSLVDYGRTIMT